MQQSLARRLAQAYPLILERRVGGSQLSPWGTNTVAVIWTLVSAVPFGSPSSSLASGPSPPEGPAPGHVHQCTGVHPGPPGPCSQWAQDPSPPIRGPAPHAQRACFSLTQQQADASPGYSQPCRLASRPAPVLGSAGP